MPSTGFYLFLRRSEIRSDRKPWMCQCPQRASTYFFEDDSKSVKRIYHVSMPSTGFYLFLLVIPKFFGDRTYTVSMPSTGFYLFLRMENSHDNNNGILCQCPQRASTYFFRECTVNVMTI